MPPRLLLSGYFGLGNTGDEAIFEAMVDALRQADPGVELEALVADPGAAEALGVRPIPRKDLPSIVRALRRCDLLISGGGGLIQDSTGVGSVIYYLGVCTLARLLGRPVMLYCQGFGPVRTPLGRRLARLLANRVTLITVRDQESADEMRALGITRPPLRVTADPALALAPAETARTREILAAEGLSGEVGRLEGPTGRHPGVGPLVALTVREWPGLPLEELARALTAFRDDENARYLLIPFHPELDREPSERLAQLIGARVVERDYRPKEVAGLLACCDLVVGMRLHSLILAAAAGVPMLGLSYDPKVERFCRRAGALALDIEEISSERLREALSHLLTGRNHQRRRQASAVEPMAAAARRCAWTAVGLGRKEPVGAALKALETGESDQSKEPADVDSGRERTRQQL